MGGRVGIALTVFVAIVLIGGLGSSLNDALLEQVQEQRLRGVTGELRARLETQLRIGLALAENQYAQSMLEDVLARSPMLDSIEIDSDNGTVLFDTDRALRGQPVPGPWRDAARANPDGWHTVRRDEHSVGTSLRDAFGQPAGSLVWTRQETRDAGATRTLFIEVVLIAFATAALAFAAGTAMEHLMRSRRARDLSRLRALDVGGGDAIASAARVISEARAELSHVDREAHRIAGIET